MSPKVLFFHTVQKFGNFSLKDHKSAGIWEKGTQIPPTFMAFVTEDPLIFALHARVWGECCSLKHGQKLANFVFLKQNRAIWWIRLGAKFDNKGDENKISILQAQPRLKCALWMNFTGGQGWYTGHHPPGQTRKGIYPTTTLYMILHILAL